MNRTSPAQASPRIIVIMAYSPFPKRWPSFNQGVDSLSRSPCALTSSVRSPASRGPASEPPPAHGSAAGSRRGGLRKDSHFGFGEVRTPLGNFLHFLGIFCHHRSHLLGLFQNLHDAPELVGGQSPPGGGVHHKHRPLQGRDEVTSLLELRPLGGRVQGAWGPVHGVFLVICDVELTPQLAPSWQADVQILAANPGHPDLLGTSSIISAPAEDQSPLHENHRQHAPPGRPPGAEACEWREPPPEGTY